MRCYFRFVWNYFEWSVWGLETQIVWVYIQSSSVIVQYYCTDNGVATERWIHSGFSQSSHMVAADPWVMSRPVCPPDRVLRTEPALIPINPSGLHHIPPHLHDGWQWATGRTN